MTAHEEYKKRSAGMNMMENAGAWAVTYWTAEDVLSIARADDHPLTDEEAEQIFDRISNRLHERMVEAGWDIVNEGLVDWVKERDE